MTILLVVLAAWVSWELVTIRAGWEVLLEVGAGTGSVYLLRWYWWRINAWSEIAAMTTALIVSLAHSLARAVSRLRAGRFRQADACSPPLLTTARLGCRHAPHSSRAAADPGQVLSPRPARCFRLETHCAASPPTYPRSEASDAIF